MRRSRRVEAPTRRTWPRWWRTGGIASQTVHIRAALLSKAACGMSRSTMPLACRPDIGTEDLLDSQARVDEEFLARCPAAVGRDDIGIERLNQRDSAGVLAGEGRLDLVCDPRFQPRLDLWTHLGQEMKE